MKIIKKPVYDIKELPTCIQNEIIKFSFILFFSIIAFSLFSLKTRNIQYLPYGAGLLVIGIAALLSWYSKFAYDKAIFVEGTLVKIEEGSDRIKDKFLKMFEKMVRPKYIIQLNDGTFLTVIKTSRKKVKAGAILRIYFIPSSLVETNNEIILSSSLYMEILKKN